MANRLKAFALLAILFSAIIFACEHLAGREGVIVGSFVSLGLFFFSYWFSGPIILTFYDAHQVPKDRYDNLHVIIGKLSRKAGIFPPEVYVIPSRAPNAFSVGRGPSHSMMAFSEGLLALLDNEELEGVISHEIAHIANCEVIFSTVVATLAGSVLFMAKLLFMGGKRGQGHEDGNILITIITVLLSPISLILIQLTISDSREFIADKNGASYCENPEWIARALEKVEEGMAKQPFHEVLAATCHMFVIHPLVNGIFLNLYSTHPPVRERIRRLMEFRG